MATRVPPHNLNAEESLLGAMLLSRDAVNTAAETGIGVEHFYKPAHQHVFDAMRSLLTIGEPIDPVTVADELRPSFRLFTQPRPVVTCHPHILRQLRMAAHPAPQTVGRHMTHMTNLPLARISATVSNRRDGCLCPRSRTHRPGPRCRPRSLR